MPVFMFMSKKMDENRHQKASQQTGKRVINVRYTSGTRTPISQVMHIAHIFYVL